MADDDASVRATLSAAGLAALLGAAGVLHFAQPRPFEHLIPRQLGNPRAWVLGSGVAELACAVAVAIPQTRRVGALASAALFVGVFPGNVKMALGSRPGGGSWASGRAVAWGRLPMQAPLVAWALAVARQARSGRTSSARL